MKRPANLPGISTLHGAFAQGRIEPERITLFQEWTRLTTDNHGEMHGEPIIGFYCANTRLMTRHRIELNGASVAHRLSVQLKANEWSSVGAVLHSSEQGNLPSGSRPEGATELRILRKVDGGLGELITVKNGRNSTRKIHLVIHFACPIQDDEFDEEEKKFGHSDIAGLPARVKAVTRDRMKARLRFARDFGKRKAVPELGLPPGEVIRELEITAAILPDGARGKISLHGWRSNRLEVVAHLKSHEELKLELRYEPIIDGKRFHAPCLREGLSPLPRVLSDLPENALKVDSGNSTFNMIVGQAMSDFKTLQFPAGMIAGIPRYIGIFGRDTLIASRQGMLFAPEVVEPALTKIAEYQGIRHSAWRDEEKGRMLHERRLNPRSETGDMNRDLYYGDVASTPLWVITLAAQFRWSGDRELIRRHLKTLLRCCTWITTRLHQGGGFITYHTEVRKASQANRNQAWKDSGDAIVDEHGHIRNPPLALVEIQAFAYQALQEASFLLSQIGLEKDYSKITRDLKARFNQRFWLPEERFYAFALNAIGRPVRSRTSNVGQCIASGIMDEDKIGDVVRGLLDDSLFSGWGVRTLACDNPAYDPFSYHRGSVWPFDNALIAEGVARAGYREEANRIISAQLGLATIFQHMRLPEVFSGHRRDPATPTPGIYNFANPLQTWSVTAISQFLQTILGLVPAAEEGVVYVDPHLPEWLPWIELSDLSIAGARVRLRAWRERGRTLWKVRVLSRSKHVEFVQPRSRLAA